MNLQVPPNLNPNDHRLMLRAGINDWGGISPVTQDYVKSRKLHGRTWPTLAERCREAGFTLLERLAIYDEFLDQPSSFRGLEDRWQKNFKTISFKARMTFSTKIDPQYCDSLSALG
jgi:hypothetical protein